MSRKTLRRGDHSLCVAQESTLSQKASWDLRPADPGFYSTPQGFASVWSFRCRWIMILTQSFGLAALWKVLKGRGKICYYWTKVKITHDTTLKINMRQEWKSSCPDCIPQRWPLFWYVCYWNLFLCLLTHTYICIKYTRFLFYTKIELPCTWCIF